MYDIYDRVCVVLIATVSALTQRSDGFVIIENLIRFSIKPNKCGTHTHTYTLPYKTCGTMHACIGIIGGIIAMCD